ncbi:Phage-related protein [Pediococcus damnosus]|uniref:type II toxin-antitoxin system HicB family antitoxin n=1 Tax=Pediococcus damnosus TaxID=51663 RepID=UPI00078DC725|nr:type II toxin-antitoxin system HicB family antitoxin [Pediococcus damnosus]AMV69925.1 Phage-related protein [Pediococcus damnosus]
MRLVAYPAILDDSENKPGQYTVTFPDVPGAITDGNNLEEALYNAPEALGLVLFDEKVLPKSSSLQTIQKQNPDKIVTYISVDLDFIRRNSYKPTVKKNTRISAELAKKAENQGINFSATLTAALEEKLSN